MSIDVVDKIIQSDKSGGSKLVKLYSVVMLNYRQPLGDKAWDEIDKLFGDETMTQSFSFLTGILTGWDGKDAEKIFTKFIQEELDSLK